MFTDASMMQHVDKKSRFHPEIDLIVLNDTRRPTTGGDFVYTVMRDELIRQGFRISEMSIPLLISPIRARVSHDLPGKLSLLFVEMLAYFRCYVASLRRFVHGSSLVITSSCPTFPVFGHLTYHQPKAGICTDFIRQSDSTRRMIGYKVQENDRLSPLWLLAKRLVRLHLSNSIFTKNLVKQIYGLDSSVLYPPVSVAKYLKFDIHAKRKPYVYITRPQAITGIRLLPQVARNLPKNIKLIITGKLDAAGRETLRSLKNSRTDFEYLGFVEEAVKMDILRKSSAYINLAWNETFGITVVEALAAGCVPVAHDSGSIPEFLPEELRYSGAEECAEKTVMCINSGGSLRERLRTIALEFDEGIFRKNFVFFVEQLERMLPELDSASIPVLPKNSVCKVDPDV